MPWLPLNREQDMPGARLPMRKLRELLRLKAAGLSSRQIGASLGIGGTTVVDYLGRARRSGVAWPLPDDMSDEALEATLFPQPANVPMDQRPLPHWPTMYTELKRAGVTLQLLWEEHRDQHPTSYGYSRFCELYRAWEGKLSPTMRQTHVAGERMFVDYAGTTIDIFDAASGEVLTCQLFVAVLGGSSYTYAEATRTQALSDWIGSHTRTFAFFGGVPGMVVSDNLKSGITKACFYEPAVNRSYEEMAQHYRTAIVPARPYKPRDKAKVEVGVLLATRWIIAKLRNRKFFTLPELNEAIAECLTTLNNRVSRHLGASRLALFDEVERSALKALPAELFEFAEWSQVTAGLDYHVDVGKHYYSVPYTLLKEKMWARITARTVEVLHKGRRVAAHVRSSAKRKKTTLPEHMPDSHRRYAEWTPERLQRRAAEIGPSTAILIEIILRERSHPEQGFRAGIGILRLAKSFEPARFEIACAHALAIGARSYRSVVSILRTNADLARHRHDDRNRPATAADGTIAHDNIRGPTYFH
jgi:transposase